ncbi:Precursor of CEP14 [Cardamine amara subsp. amara]|uniref:Precursor of CEP14 n=1 Tax=Cardamine amara subsp. amara TaxID=228776 RepID=A0ABD1B1J4_CARAN
MAVRLVTIWLFIVIAVIISVSASPVSSRKLLEMKKQENLTVREEEKSHVPHVTKTSTLTALPKGKIPTSTPSKKGHAAVFTVNLRSRHLSTVDRFLQAVPSPGVGH